MNTQYKLEEANTIAEQIIRILQPQCDRIQIAGSIRRRRPTVHDIDIVTLPTPTPLDNITTTLSNHYTIKANGPKVKRLLANNIQADIYITTPDTWTTTLLIRTGSKENNIRLCTIARSKGLQLHANGDGLTDQGGNTIPCHTEEAIYHALGIPYQEPHQREPQHQNPDNPHYNPEEIIEAYYKGDHIYIIRDQSLRNHLPPDAIWYTLEEAQSLAHSSDWTKIMIHTAKREVSTNQQPSLPLSQAGR
jgi:hypothetical protein